MQKIPLTQNLFALVDDEDFEWLNQWKWHAHKQGKTWYAKRRMPKNKKTVFIPMHRQITNVSQEMTVDHIDFDGLNNQRTNLRICSKAQNGMHRPAQVS